MSILCYKVNKENPIVAGKGRKEKERKP